MKYVIFILVLLSVPETFRFWRGTYWAIHNCNNAKKKYHFYYIEHFPNGTQEYFNYCEGLKNALRNGY